jgi:hypothetical protein
MEGRHDLTPQTKRAILSRLAGGYKRKRICAEFDVTTAELNAIKEWAKRLNNDDVGIAEVDERQSTYIPTPDEIDTACADIQAGWSDDERERRTFCPVGELEISFIRVGAQRHAKHGGDR